MASWNTPAGLKRSPRALLPWSSCLNGAKIIETETCSTKWPVSSRSLASPERHRSSDALNCPRHEARRRPMRRNREDKLDLAYVGGEADAATHRAEDGVTDEEAQAVTR